ncbi:cortical protein marker for cell polarity-domain-containing protein [Xylariomycetidae sp. FL0641]|nr:cortical protein marker for cell polarity-domain-containing protein [Xylariomycetidae sp. FL0641]
MRIHFRQAPVQGSCSPPAWLLTLTSFAALSCALTVNQIPDPNLDTSELGQVGIAGQFDGISLYQYEGQTEQAFTSNGSEQLMFRLPNGLFSSIAAVDASIQTMCLFQGNIIVGGNFTSLGGEQFQGIALVNVTDGKPSPLDPELNGQVNSLLCDDTEGTVYLGGSFRFKNSTNAMTWSAGSGYASLPFAGFNGPVTSIAKAPSGHIIFGGSFTGLGNTSTPAEADAQSINLSTADISAEQSTTQAGFSDPKNIVCKTDGTDAAGSTWLLEDGKPGAWRASFNFGFNPTKIRLFNTHQDGRGTKTWRFTAQPNNGILNMSYIDPATGQNLSCTSECPLSHNESVKYQDFHFSPVIGMNAFRIDISEFYGSGGGLDGIQLFQNNSFAYAINDFNEPACANTTTPSEATATGPWEVTPSRQSNSDYLSAVLSTPITSDAASVVFRPDVKDSGDYIIKLYTPGCLQDGTCLQRGQVNLTATLNTTGVVQQLNGGTTIYQTNEFDKYDQIFIGHIDGASSDGFRPSITMAPVAGQVLQTDTMVMVAQRIGIELINSSGGLNGLFEYDPSKDTVDTSDFSSSAFDKLGSSFASNSAVAALASTDDRVFIGGNFTSDEVQNIAAIDNDGKTVSLASGLDGQAISMYLNETQLFVGGDFDGTHDGATTGLGSVAVYDSSDNTWSPLGAGVDGVVVNIAPLTLNMTGNTTEDAIALTGDFTQIRAFDQNDAVNVTGFAVWVPSQNNWLQNIEGPVPLLDGLLSSYLLDAGEIGTLYAGSMTAQTLRAYGAASANTVLSDFPVNLQPPISSGSASTVSKRESLLDTADSVSGVVTGAFDSNNGRNLTILAGHFAADASNGSTVYNMAVIDRKKSDTVTGLATEELSDSVILAVAVQGNNVYAGGRIDGTIAPGTQVRGLLSYNLDSNSYSTQPPILDGNDVAVSAVTVRPKSGDLYVGGVFETAGDLPCPAVCMLDTGTNQWTRPGFGLNGTVHTMMWSSNTVLLVGGQLTLNDSDVSLASFDVSKSEWTAFTDATALPGPVDAMTAANPESDKIWAAGTSTDNTAYVMKFDGSSWKSSGITLEDDSVVSSLQVFTVTDSHDSTDIISSNEVLMLTGSIGIPDFGTASSAIFNGTTLQPYVLTSNTQSASGSGSIAKVFVENQNFFTKSSNGHLAVGYVVLISLAISLGLMFLIVVAGLALDRYRKKREGYVPAPTSMFDRGSGMQRIPPHELLDSLNHGRPGAPRV